MRTDVKVILVVVAVVAIVFGVWYKFYFHAGDKPLPNKPLEEARASSGEGSTAFEDNSLPGAGNSIDSGYGDTGSRRASSDTSPPANTGLGSLELPSRWGTTMPSPPAETTYTVQRGDTYATIARAKYGSPALGYVIERANNNAPLIPERRIKIPPNPTLRSEPPALARTLADTNVPGSTGVDPVSGKKYYVVKKGDNGFSGVAAVVYGNGRDWKLIEDANPGVKSTALRPGQKLFYPDKPGTPAYEPATLSPSDVHTADRMTRPPPTTAPAGTVRVRTGAPSRETITGVGTFD